MPGEQFPGVFEAVGRGGQRITVWPEKDLVLVFTGGGFDTSVLAPFVVEALQAADPLPENPAATAALREKIAAAALPPPATSPAPAPPLAQAISGRTFRLANNELDLGSLALRFDDSSEATLELLWAGHAERYPVGLDGVPRFAVNAIVGLPVATTGTWRDERTFDLQIDLVGGINCYELQLRFGEGGGEVDVKIRERSGLDGAVLHGTAAPTER